MEEIRTQVAVAGAGPVGTVAAYCLASQGVDVVLLEEGADCALDLRASTFLRRSKCSSSSTSPAA